VRVKSKNTSRVITFGVFKITFGVFKITFGVFEITSEEIQEKILTISKNERNWLFKLHYSFFVVSLHNQY
jgi:hypothetical protein